MELRDVHVRLPVRTGSPFRRAAVHALTGADLAIAPGETVGIVGESGCGKSTLAKVLVGLQRPTSGTVMFEGEDVTTLRRAERAKRLGAAVGMIFQDPATALNRRLSVRSILRDPLDVHRRGTSAERDERVRELMSLVGLPASAEAALPGQLSGGQRQRVAIARALMLEPSLLVADEPTSALDVSVRAQILNLLLDLQDRLGLSMVFVSHDIQTVRRVSDRVITMYLGRIVEDAPSGAVAGGDTRHPYTRALMSATPSLLDPMEAIRLDGPFPSAVRPPSGCPFRTRCWRATAECGERMPDFVTASPSVPSSSSVPGHRYRCLHPITDPSDLPLATVPQENP
ncbi:oligopeptide/dipeptide ABC transporter ATP-binding protein [Actinomadura sp. 9N407]|uniref:oligopeptide/dipeptide ABC transporter ATP-binding protein n=1 Tax=Actinomadura sp. 9N407 TaxID=3375154 RepID=UPI0037A51331